MTSLALLPLLLCVDPPQTRPLLELDLDYETAYATRAGEFVTERGETAAGVAIAWLAPSELRFGLEARISTIANDPNGSAIGSPNPFVADLIALAEYRWSISSFAFGPQLGAGGEIFAGQRGRAGGIFEFGIEGTFRFNDTWSVHLRFAFSPTVGLEDASGPQSYWRFVGGVEWAGPI